MAGALHKNLEKTAMPLRNLLTPSTPHWVRAAALCLTGFCLLPGHHAKAQNTAIAYAYPVGN
jgi:hypothetical protein